MESQEGVSTGEGKFEGKCKIILPVRTMVAVSCEV